MCQIETMRGEACGIVPGFMGGAEGVEDKLGTLAVNEDVSRYVL